jgi:hypothetical protein
MYNQIESRENIYSKKKFHMEIIFALNYPQRELFPYEIFFAVT